MMKKVAVKWRLNYFECNSPWEMTNYAIRISSILMNINWKVKKSCNIVYFYSNSSGGLDWKLAAQLAEASSVPHSMKTTKKGHFTPMKSKFFGFICH